MSEMPQPDDQPEPVEVPEQPQDTVNDPDDVHGSDVTAEAGAPEPTD
ncbi:hypothetical protein [Actinoplanes teichomyceticus]|uniref:Uncharacterized protein n=1 Tax=Actinoplanes teichomyceticus TaxID=1867 RepID=A0A561WBD3_ACTTI|nr:hypothetical protein [Actinoplanes teichomyceticus]TWG21168.1 hypothetical protein FHX34_103698 [Actinoplanes teichomyceticus]GIF14989.1 hypothetical protein Ate01nite_50210 [Actinoplanes teichomyceticus]